MHDALARRLPPAETAAGLGVVIEAIARGAVAVERLTRQAALADVLGDTGEINVQGELVQRLDAEGTRIFVAALRDCGRVAGLACEELEAMVHVSDAPDHPYLALFDPVDGSSNIDVGVTIGSIFALYRRLDDAPVDEATLRRPGRDQIAACYAIYGSSTVLVVATRAGVDGFTLDPGSGAFRLTHRDIRIPAKVSCYSVNEGNQDRWTSTHAGRRGRAARALRAALRRLAGRRLPPQPAQGRHLPLPRRRQEPGRQAAPGLRGQPPELRRGAGRGTGQHRRRGRSSTCRRRRCISARR